MSHCLSFEFLNSQHFQEVFFNVPSEEIGGPDGNYVCKWQKLAGIWLKEKTYSNEAPI